MDWKKKKVLVTGAGGFIGSHLTERLLELGAGVRAFVRYNSFNRWGWIDSFPKDLKAKIDVFSSDITDERDLKKSMKDIDIVFHLAALIAIPHSYKSPISFTKTNVEGTANVLQTALNHSVEKIVLTSSSEVYGTAEYIPMDEKHPLRAQSPYAASKIGADMLAESFHKSFDLPVAIIRPFNTYGPRQSARAIIPAIITQILTKKVVRLGSLAPVRDLTFVKDTIEGFIKITESEESVGEVINIGRGQGIVIGDLLNKITKIMNKDVEIKQDRERIRPSKSEVTKLVCDNRKAKSLIGWEPRYSFEEGLKETIDWFQKHIDMYKTDIYNI